MFRCTKFQLLYFFDYKQGDLDICGTLTVRTLNITELTYNELDVSLLTVDTCFNTTGYSQFLKNVAIGKEVTSTDSYILDVSGNREEEEEVDTDRCVQNRTMDR